MTALDATQVTTHLASLADPTKAENSAWFFKTGPGEYGEGDRFRGIRVPELRKLVRTYRALPHAEVRKLLESPWHEDRLLALLLWVEQYRKSDATTRQQIFDDYLTHTAYINNWDLVDSSAEHIVGAHLYVNPQAGAHQNDRANGNHAHAELLTRLAHSANLWERRIAMLATFHFIRKDEFEAPLRVAALLLHDEEDLIHKAVGWMLREIGQRDLPTEEAFLLPRYQTMPRTMLRYAIEKFPEDRRQAYLRGTA